MRALLEQFAADYAAAQQKLSGHGDDRSSIRYPTVFLFIGDEAGQGIEPMLRSNELRWENGAGVVYFHVASGDAAGGESAGPTDSSSGKTAGFGAAGGSGVTAKIGTAGGSGITADSGAAGGSGATATNSGAAGRFGVAAKIGAAGMSRTAADYGGAADAGVTGLTRGGDGSPKVARLALTGLPPARPNGKSGRKDIWHAFHGDQRNLVKLNRALRGVCDTIADYGRLYASFDRLHLAVVTRVDDPLNALVSEITLLAQSIFLQLFKSVQMDLYALLSEREQSETFGYDGAVGISFLRELEGMQHPDYAYSAHLQVTGEGLSIPVVHQAAPLFDLVYMLSDRNERGITSPGGMFDNYEIIGRILLLKNRKRGSAAADPDDGGYNNSTFRNSLMAESGRQGFVSAGLAAVRRPNHSIALTVLYHFCRGLAARLQSGPEPDFRGKLDFLGMDPASMESRLAGIIPEESRIGDMTGIMTSGARYEELRRLTLREAEEALFGDSCESFFEQHFARVAQRRLGELQVGEELRRAIEKHVAAQPQIGFYQLFEWTRDRDKSAAGSMMEGLRMLIRDKAAAADLAREELERCREERADELKFQRLPLMDKHNLRAFVRAFLDAVYRRKWLLLKLEAELECYRRFAAELEAIHETCRLRVERMEQLQETIRTAALHSIRMEDDYTGQNIFDYYERVTDGLMDEIADKRGAAAFLEERSVGNVTELLDRGIEKLAERLIDVCRKRLLTSAPFALPFEEELLRRANVSIDYSNRKALSQEDLFQRLYRTLEDKAVIHIRLLEYTHEHRYEEKYLFGDCEGEFIRYSREADESSRLHKLGCVHEKRGSGVEKLNLMGGFHLEDLMYYRNCKVYYEAYLQNGYEFHGAAFERLPELR